MHFSAATWRVKYAYVIRIGPNAPLALLDQFEKGTFQSHRRDADSHVLLKCH